PGGGGVGVAARPAGGPGARAWPAPERDVGGADRRAGGGGDGQRVAGPGVGVPRRRGGRRGGGRPRRRPAGGGQSGVENSRGHRTAVKNGSAVQLERS